MYTGIKLYSTSTILRGLPVVFDITLLTLSKYLSGSKYWIYYILLLSPIIICAKRSRPYLKTKRAHTIFLDNGKFIDIGCWNKIPRYHNINRDILKDTFVYCLLTKSDLAFNCFSMQNLFLVKFFSIYRGQFRNFNLNFNGKKKLSYQKFDCLI